MYRISVKEGKEKQLIKHHPWVFSGAIDKVSPPFENGDWAEITSSSGSFIAYGWYDEKSHILLHLLSWDRSQKVGNDLIRSLVKESILRRRPYFSSPDTTSFRIIHGEADFLPGIAADVYANQIRVIISSRFAEHFLPEIISELTSTLKPLLIQVTADPQYAPQEGISEKVRYFRDGEEIKESDADLKNVQAEGSYTVPATVKINGYDNVGVKGSYQVIVNVSLAQQTQPDPTPDPNPDPGSEARIMPEPQAAAEEPTDVVNTHEQAENA